MGLAASQARLLMLTGRKDDVEGQLMRIANQRLSLSRQSAQLSEDYTDALNATKLTLNTGSSDVDVTYNGLMSPNALGTQYLLRTASGAVVLNDSYYSALKLSGTSGNLTYSVGGAAAFLKAMNVSNADTEADALDKSCGPNTKTITPPKPTPTDNTITPGSLHTSYDSSDVFRKLDTNYTTGLTDFYGKGVTYSGGAYCFYQNDSVSYGDNKVYDPTTKQYENPGINGAAIGALDKTVDMITGNTTSALVDVLSDDKHFGSNWGAVKGKIMGAAERAAVTTKLFYEGQMSFDAIRNDGGEDATEDNNKHTVVATTGSNSICDNSYGRHEFYIDPAQVVLTFLAFFDAECSGIDTDTPELLAAYRHASGNGTKLDTDADETSKLADMILPQTSSTVNNNTRYSTVNNGSHCGTYSIGANGKQMDLKGCSSDGVTPASGSDPSLASGNADYYYHLFVAICNFGWVHDSSVDNSTYLQTRIQNGDIIVDKRQGNDWVPISLSSPDSPFAKESDDNAIKKAEAKYDAQKDELDCKEKQLDLKMNNLDTERQAITTEIDSVKKIIDKNMDMFKLFQQG